MKHISHKWFAAVMLAILLTFSNLASAFTDVIRSIFIDYGDFTELSDNLYFDNTLTQQEQQEMLTLLEQAQSKIAEFYGRTSAHPVIIVVKDQATADQFGIGSTPGKYLFAPWGGYLILSYPEKSVDVIAHEWVHAEIVERVGYWQRQTEIPTWFDEGAALQLDDRPNYQINNIEFTEQELTAVQKLETPSQFWTLDAQQNIRHYQLSKIAVLQLFIDYPPETFYQKLAQIRNGESFESVFKSQSTEQ